MPPGIAEHEFFDDEQGTPKETEPGSYGCQREPPDTPIPVRNFFDSASIGQQSREASRETRSQSKDWDEALERVKYEYTRLVGLTQDHHTIFQNTTAGVRRIFLRLSQLLQRQPATLLTTDMEYPGIMALLDENWRGELVIAEVADYVWSGQPERVAETLAEAMLITRPAVMYVSHVARATGWVLDKRLLDFAREINPRVVLVVDGAQAVGNIEVGESFLRKTDFYVASGHKWLCGKETVGLVTAEPAWVLPDPSQSYSRRVGSGGTGNLEALKSLWRALEDFTGPARRDDGEEPQPSSPRTRMEEIQDWNRALAGKFVAELRDRSLPVRAVSGAGDDQHWSGLTTITGNTRRMYDTLTKRGVICTHLKHEAWVGEEGAAASGARFRVAIGNDTGVSIRKGDLRRDKWGPPLPSGEAVRFCFHYYHDQRHIEQLVEGIHEALT